jgi:hypothetical protein
VTGAILVSRPAEARRSKNPASPRASALKGGVFTSPKGHTSGRRRDEPSWYVKYDIHNADMATRSLTTAWFWLGRMAIDVSVIVLPTAIPLLLLGMRAGAPA